MGIPQFRPWNFGLVGLRDVVALRVPMAFEGRSEIAVTQQLGTGRSRFRVPGLAELLSAAILPLEPRRAAKTANPRSGHSDLLQNLTAQPALAHRPSLAAGNRHGHVPPREVGGTRFNLNRRMKRPCLVVLLPWPSGRASGYAGLSFSGWDGPGNPGGCGSRIPSRVKAAGKSREETTWKRPSCWPRMMPTCGSFTPSGCAGPVIGSGRRPMAQRPSRP